VKTERKAIIHQSISSVTSAVRLGSLFISNPTHTILNKLDLGYIIMEKDVTKNKKHKKKKKETKNLDKAKNPQCIIIYKKIKIEK
jgi:hypothetical protein